MTDVNDVTLRDVQLFILNGLLILNSFRERHIFFNLIWVALVNVTLRCLIQLWIPVNPTMYSDKVTYEYIWVFLTILSKSVTSCLCPSIRSNIKFVFYSYIVPVHHTGESSDRYNIASEKFALNIYPYRVALSERLCSRSPFKLLILQLATVNWTL